MPHANYLEHIDYQSSYNKTTAGKARTKLYRQSNRGKINTMLRNLRRRIRKQGLPLLPEHYMRGFCALHDICPTDPSLTTQNNISKPECNALAPAHD